MIVSRCPVCKAENTASPCRRCKADLSLLLALEQQRQEALWRAKESLQARCWAEAQKQAVRADHLRRDDESRRLLAAAALLNGDYATAWRCYRELNPEKQ